MEDQIDPILFYGELNGTGNGEYMTVINPSMVQIITSISLNWQNCMWYNENTVKSYFRKKLTICSCA